MAASRNSANRRVDWRTAGVLAVIALIVIAGWHTPVLYPLRLLVVFFHELSHALAGWLTGGRVVGVQISRYEGGHCVVQGGWPFVILSAGYLGSLVWGGAILAYASRAGRPGRGAAFLGGVLIAAAAGFVRPIVSFGFLYAAGMGVVLCFLGGRAGAGVNRALLQAVGITSCFYAPLDILSDVLARPHLPSDAVLLGRLTGVPGQVWGMLWIGVSLPITLHFLRRAVLKDTRPHRA